MKYELTIIRKDPNPNFEVQLEEWKERDQLRYVNNSQPYPQAEVIENALIVSITEEQFQAVKKAVLETFI